jgi:Flp pilus assembly secretin CpaC
MHKAATTCFAVLGLVAGISAVSPAASAAGVAVALDEVRVVTFKTPVKTVFVGNPVIADITVIDPQHVFILGKSFGTTNLVALDDKGNQRINEQISVFNRAGAAVTLHRGASQVTMTCTRAQCVAAPTPGDDNGPFDAVTGQIDRRQTLSMKAAAQ